jgi:hypothetical protein
VGGIVALAVTSALLALVTSGVRRKSDWTNSAGETQSVLYRLVVGFALAAPVAVVVVCALTELQLELLLAGAVGLLVGLTALMLTRTAWGVTAATAMAVGIGVLGSREGPYEPSFGYWLPRALAGALALGALAFVARRRQKA